MTRALPLGSKPKVAVLKYLFRRYHRSINQLRFEIRKLDLWAGQTQNSQQIFVHFFNNEIRHHRNII